MDIIWKTLSVSSGIEMASLSARKGTIPPPPSSRPLNRFPCTEQSQLALSVPYTNNASSLGFHPLQWHYVL